MAVDHLDNFSYTITLSPSPPTRVGFGKLLLLVDGASNSLNSETTRTYAGVDEAQADLTAGHISQDTFDRVQIGFLQTGKPDGIKIGAVDTGGAETWGEAFSRVLAADDDFYAVCLTTRTAADIVSVASAVEADDSRQLFFQSDDADWLTTGVPSGFSTIDGYERSSGIYHDENDEVHDVAWVADRLSANPDETSADWRTQIKGVNGLTTGLTSTQKGFLEDTNHMNVALPLGPAYPLWVDPGQNMTGRSIYEILSVDWYRARTRESMTQLFATLAAQRRKLIVGAQGQAQVEAVLQQWLQTGTDMPSPHFIRGNTRVTPRPIVQADLDAKRMRFKVEAQIAQSARTLDFDVYFQNSPLAPE